MNETRPFRQIMEDLDRERDGCGEPGHKPSLDRLWVLLSETLEKLAQLEEQKNPDAAAGVTDGMAKWN